MNGNSKAEAVWVWVTRICAVAGFIVLIAVRGLEAPWGAYILLIGLFFGPDVLLKALPQVFGNGFNRNNGSDDNDRDRR